MQILTYKCSNVYTFDIMCILTFWSTCFGWFISVLFILLFIVSGWWLGWLTTPVTMELISLTMCIIYKYWCGSQSVKHCDPSGIETIECVCRRNRLSLMQLTDYCPNTANMDAVSKLQKCVCWKWTMACWISSVKTFSQTQAHDLALIVVNHRLWSHPLPFHPLSAERDWRRKGIEKQNVGGYLH